MKKERTGLMFFYFVICWAAYASLHTVLKSNAPLWNGILSAVALIGLNTAGLIYSFGLWKASEGLTKKIFGFFAASFVFVIIDCLIYLPAYNILMIPQDQVPTVLVSIDNIAYIFYAVFRVLAFGLVLSQITTHQKGKPSLVTSAPVVIIIAVITSMFFLSFGLRHWHDFSLYKAYDFAEMVLQVISFVMLVICLVVAKNKGVLYLALGYLLCILTALIMNVKLLSQAYNVSSFVETFWFLGISMLVYGLIYFKKSLLYKEEPAKWVDASDSIKIQTTLWSIMLCVIATGICFFTLAAHYMPSSSPGVFF